MKNLFPFVTSCQFLPIFTNKKTESSNPKNCFGDAGHRSSYLSHAKRALYHLSYILVLISLRASLRTQFMKNWLSICNELSIPSHYQQIQTRIIESSKFFGDAAQRSPYLSHAKRALYHLSYIPVLFKLRASFEQISWNISFPFVTSCQFIPIISKYKPELSNPQKCFGARGIDPRTSRMQSERSTIWAIPRNLQDSS